MFQIDDPTAASTMPALGAVGTPGFFQSGNPAIGQAATKLTQDFNNILMSELIGLCTLAGVTPSKANLTQLCQAIMAGPTFADVGAVNAMVVNPRVAMTGLVLGTEITVIPAFTNAGSGTLNFAGAGNINVLRPDGSSPQAGDWNAGQPLGLVYWGAVWLMKTWPRRRIVLGANLRLYVSPSGSDSNSGLSAVVPLLTIQKALDILQAGYDLGGYNAIVQLAAGTYAGAYMQFAPAVPGGAWDQGTGLVSIIGNPTTPSSVVLTANPTWNLSFGVAGMGAACYLDGVTVQNPTGGGLLAGTGGQLVVANINYAACSGDHMLAQTAGIIYPIDLGDLSGGTIGYPGSKPSFTISGGATRHFHTLAGGNIAFALGANYTLSGTPVFSAEFAHAQKNGYLGVAGITWTGAGTGTKHLAETGGGIDTGGVGAGYFPVPTAGSVTSPGWLI